MCASAPAPNARRGERVGHEPDQEAGERAPRRARSGSRRASARSAGSRGSPGRSTAAAAGRSAAGPGAPAPAPAGPGWRGQAIIGRSPAGTAGVARRQPRGGGGAGRGGRLRAAAAVACRRRAHWPATRARRWRPPLARSARESACRIRAIESSRIAGSAESLGKARARSALGGATSTRTWATDPGLAAGSSRYTRSQPACSRTTPITVPDRNPLRDTPRRGRRRAPASRPAPSRDRGRRGTRAPPSPARPDSDGATTPLALPLTVKALDPELRMRPGHRRRSSALAGAEHHAEQALGRHHRIERRDPVARAGARAAGSGRRSAWAWCSTSAATYGAAEPAARARAAGGAARSRR